MRHFVAFVFLSTCHQAFCDEPLPMGTLLDKTELLELLRANDKQLENRKLIVMRCGIEKVRPPQFWKYPDLKRYFTDDQGHLRLPPDSISYVDREEICTRGSVIGYKTTQLLSSAGEDSVVRLPKAQRWSNSNDVVKYDTDNDLFTISRDRKDGTWASGPLRLAEAVLSLGVGYGIRLRQIDRFDPGIDGSYRVSGPLELIEGSVYAAELTIGRDLLVRKALLSWEGSWKAAIHIESEGTAIGGGQLLVGGDLLVAQSGSFRHTTSSRAVDDAGAERQRCDSDRRFRIKVVSLSDPLATDEFRTFTDIEPFEGARVIKREPMPPSEPDEFRAFVGIKPLEDAGVVDRHDVLPSKPAVPPR